MKRVVWKYPLPPSADVSTTTVPSDGRLVHVGLQGHTPTLWVEVDPTSPPRDHRFKIVGTGDHAIEAATDRHVGTVIDGPFEWHIYEVLPAMPSVFDRGVVTP